MSGVPNLRGLGGSLLLGMAAATYFLTPVVEQFLRLTPAKLYFIQHVPDRLDYVVVLGLILVIGLATGLLDWTGARYSGPVRRLFESPLWLMCALGIEHVVYQHLSRSPPLWNMVTRAWSRVGITATDGWFITGMACALPVFVGFYFWPKAWSSARPLVCGGAAALWLACALKIVSPPAAIPESRSFSKSNPSRLQAVHSLGPDSPVVWIILDEWDYDLTFKRHDQKTFPEFEQLRAQSVFLENVHAAGTVTLRAIPSLLMGRSVKDYRATGAAGGQFVATAAISESFPGPGTIFDSASQFGYRSHIVGWYHPYCRMFSGQIDSCWWDDLLMPELRPAYPPLSQAAAFFRESIELELMPGIGPANGILRQLERIDPMIDQAAQAASHGGRSFSFLHLPVPHAPFFKLDSVGRMVPLRSNADGYNSGLDAADRAIGSLRAAMTKADVWDQALVVVTSDHPYRYQFIGGYGNGHIPMMIKFPHQMAPIIYSQPFQAVDTKNLIEDFMRGNLSTPEHAVAWLDHSSAPAGTPESIGSIPHREGLRR